MVNIIEILKAHSIEYNDSGSNVKEGNVNVKCPFCHNDPSKHMGINLETGKYGCWRDDSHRGNKLENLFARLLHTTRERAREILGIGTFVNTEDFATNALKDIESETIRKKEKVKDKETKIGGKKTLSLSSELRPLWQDCREFNRDPFLKYLYGRGFSDPVALAERYKLMFATYASWRYRIVLPVYYRKQLATWVGRTISSGNSLKYKDLSIEESVRHAKYCLFDHTRLFEGGRKLFITEGFFDAMKIGWSLRNSDMKATCLFTKSMTQEQSKLLIRLAPLYKKVVVLLDDDATAQAMGVKARLSVFAKNVMLGTIPGNFKDPCEMTEEAVVRKWGA